MTTRGSSESTYMRTVAITLALLGLVGLAVWWVTLEQPDSADPDSGRDQHTAASGSVASASVLGKKRVALVIGNDRYINSPKLTNAVNDARGIAEALRDDLGFTLIGDSAQVDLSRAQALDRLEQFRHASATADIALFYFAGHGMVQAGENWLLPSDDRSIAFREDLPVHALSQATVLERMKGNVNVMVLDACRNNPLPSREGGRGDATRGLQPIGGPRGTLVAYSAGVGEVASDGTSFTRELLKRIRTPGLRLDDLFRTVGDAVYDASDRRQNPAILDQLRDGAVYLLPAIPVSLSPDAERLAFEAAQSSNTEASWAAYLKHYPAGAHAGVAAVQLAALSPPRPDPGPAPAPSNEWLSRDCPDCPEMVRIPGGKFRMGDLNGTGPWWEKPIHEVSVRTFSGGKYEVTFAAWDACVSAGGCSKRPSDEGWGRGNRPAINVSWDDAQQYVKWLSDKTGRIYRLLSRSEFEYVARAGTTTEFPWGNTASHDAANYGKDKCCDGLADGLDKWVNTSPVGSFSANQWGLHDVQGNVSEWTQDCAHDGYIDAPTDGSARTRGGNCNLRTESGGSWLSEPKSLRSATHYSYTASAATNSLGFRLARTD